MVTPGIRVTVGEAAAPPATASDTVIGLIGTATGAAVGIPVVGDLTLVSSSTEAAVFGGSGTIPDALDAIYTNVTDEVIVSRYDHSIADADDRAAAIVAAINLLLSAEDEHSRRPSIVIAPGLTWNLDAGGEMAPNDTENDVVSALNSLAVSLGAVALGAAPPTSRALAISWAANNEGEAFVGVFPHVRPTGVTTQRDPTPFVAGALARMDAEFGYWANPALKSVLGITRNDPRISFAFDNPSSDAGLLTAANLMTIVPHGGHRLWGSRLNTTSTSLRRYINVRRIEQVVRRTLATANAEALAREIRAGYVDFVTGQVNAFFGDLRAAGAIIEGSCVPDVAQNTQTNLANGDVYFDTGFTPVVPAQRLNFKNHLRTVGLVG